MGIVIDGAPESMRWLLWLALFIQWGLTLGFLIWWASAMSRALNACSHFNRRMDGGAPWLLLIPLFGFIWQYIAVKSTAESLAQEYHHRGWKSDEGRPGIEIGMITASLIIVVFLVRILIPDLNPGLSFFLTLAICVCIYMHRERLSGFTERLEQANIETPAYFAFDQHNNPFAAPQQPQFFTGQQQPAQQQETHQPAPGWDGLSTWTPPSNWIEPDLSDPRPWFS